MQCTCNEHSPFLWHKHQRDSIFVQDSYFRPKGESGKTTGQIASDSVDTRRAKGEDVGYMKGMSRKREEEIIAYKQFGVYSRATVSVKPFKNKHEK